MINGVGSLRDGVAEGRAARQAQATYTQQQDVAKGCVEERHDWRENWNKKKVPL